MGSAAESLDFLLAAMGFGSFILLWLAVILGLALRNARVHATRRRATIHGLHQTVALVGLCLGAVHGFSQLVVPGGSVRLVDVVVPFVNPDDPIGIGLGVLGLEVMLAVTLALAIQARLGEARSRALHGLTYAAFLLVGAHVLISGSDVAPVVVWAPVLAACVVTILLWLTTMPLIGGGRPLLGQPMSVSISQGPDIAVHVDEQRCTLSGVCADAAPDVFRLDDDGALSYRAIVPRDRSEAVMRAVDLCPARAIATGRPPRRKTTQHSPEPARTTLLMRANDPRLRLPRSEDYRGRP